MSETISTTPTSTNEMREYAHLHVHTCYSILDGMSSIKKLVDKAIGDGMRGMALTDHGDMFGIKELFDYCNGVNKGRKKEGLPPFKPVFGCELYVARRGDKTLKTEKADVGGYHLIVLAKNEVGYHNLIKLVSRAWVDGFYMRPRVDHKDLEELHEGLIVTSACIAGEVPAKILKDDLAGAEESMLWFKNIWGDDYYIELQRHEVKDPNIRANRESFILQQQANAELIKLARKHDVKLVCTNDVHFVDEADAEAHDILLCLSTGKDYDDPDRMRYSKQEWFKTQAEMNEVFADIPEALSNTVEIIDKVETYDLESAPIMPFFPIPEDFGTEEGWRQKFSEDDLFREFTSDENGENQLPEDEGRKKIEKLGGYDKIYRIKFEADYLGKLAYEGAARLYPMPLAKEVDDRIRFELHIMKTMGFPGYFLIVQDFINAARQELGVWVGPGRGSAAGSVVAYCLGITKLDPMKYDLLFERFLNPDRISLPDIDTDFDDDGRGKVLQWVINKYGKENCAHIITYSTMATKNSIKDVARVLRLPLDKSNALCKAIPDRLSLDGKDLKMNLGNAIKCTPELREAEASPDPVLANTIKYARMLEGTVRGTGIHACGFIICRDAISDHVPVSTADDPDFPGIKTPVTQYDGHVIESTGLIKMDFLGLKTLSEMKEACRVIKEAHGVDIDLDTIPIDDELTYKLYQEGRTVGTFQFESAGMQKYLRELHPTVFGDLVAMNALYRPGPMGYIPDFIDRKHGRKPITYDIPVMEKYLKDTYGITVYQEQVMLLSRLLADFTRGESDALRKAMGKKKKDIVDQMKPKFIEGGVKNGHDPKVLEKIWGDWEAFASYAFNKSHAACYSWVAYQTAYLKAHYPAEFMAALLTRRSGTITEVTKLLEECRAMKIDALGPDVNESMKGFSVNKKGQIRFGLAAIKGMGEGAADAIISERQKNGPYKDIYDFVERVNLGQVNRKALESLAVAGALDSFDGVKREHMFVPFDRTHSFSEVLMEYAQRFQTDKNQAANSLFGDMGMEMTIKKPELPKQFEAWSHLERLNRERELVGIYISGHPLDEYSVIVKNVCNMTCNDITDLDSFANRDVQLAGIVSSVRRGISKNGKPYGIVKLEDYSDSPGEIALFGDPWGRWQGYFAENAAVFITARVEPRWRSTKELAFNIVNVEWLSDVKDSKVKSITIHINKDKLQENDVTNLLTILENNPGNATLNINFVDYTNRYQLPMQSLSTKVNVTRELIDYIAGADPFEYSLND